MLLVGQSFLSTTERIRCLGYPSHDTGGVIWIVCLRTGPLRGLCMRWTRRVFVMMVVDGRKVDGHAELLTLPFTALSACLYLHPSPPLSSPF